MSKFKIGIIGAGGIVETNHLPAIAASDQAEIAWIYDKNPSRAELVAKMYGLSVLGEAQLWPAIATVDCCLLATPYGVRRSYIDACRNAGIGLVIEKPFAFSRREHEEYCAGFKEWAIAINLQRRYYLSVATLHRIIRTAIFGRLVAIRFNQGYFSLKGGSGYLSDVRLAGGGVIAESAIHSLDIILWITGASQVSVTRMRSLHKDRLDYDSEFESDIVTPFGNIPVHCAVSTLRNLASGLELEFEQATVSCDLSPDAPILVKGRAGGHANSFGPSQATGQAVSQDAGQDFYLASTLQRDELLLSATKINEAFLIFWQQFLEGMAGHTVNRTSAHESLLTSAWIEEIYKSMNVA